MKVNILLNKRLRRSPVMSSPLRFALIFAGALACVVLAPYFAKFSGELSTSSDDWSNFGSYVGGTLGPAFALLAFVAGIQTFVESRESAKRMSLLATIHRYEADFDAACARTVTCESPWVWGKDPDQTSQITKVALRTLLHSDTIDWEQYLPSLVLGHDFQVLPSGEISQDREVILHAQSAVEGIFEYLALFREAGGEGTIIKYLEHRYEIPKNRIAIACQHTADAMALEREVDA
jgi:hypothetical protein